jgi:hypothetical protein
MMNVTWNAKIWCRCVVLMVLIGMAACSPLDAKYSDRPAKKPMVATQTAAPPAPVFSDFKDVLIPGELTEDKRHSSVIQTGEVGTGFMAFYGRVEERSVIHFFSVKMPENGWQAVTVQKSPFSTIMIFSKGNRWCTIAVKERGFTTDVRIGVAPAIE